jgi:hypothetical protein
MSNGPILFATFFFWEIEDHEKKKSMENATRKEIGDHAAHKANRVVGPSPPTCVLLTQSWTPRIHLDLKPTI